MQLLAHKINQTPISQRRDDGYINATALCKASGKLLADYKRLDTTEAFLEELSTDMGIPISKLLEVRKGGNKELQGTWAHPQVAIHLAMWCSPAFAVKVTRWVVNWMQGRSTFPTEVWQSSMLKVLDTRRDLIHHCRQLDLIAVAADGLKAKATVNGQESLERDIEVILDQLHMLSAHLSYNEIILKSAIDTSLQPSTTNSLSKTSTPPNPTPGTST